MLRHFTIFALTIISAASLMNCASAEGDMKLVDYELYRDNSPLEIVIQDGHSDRIPSVDVSPDGRFIASGSFDKTVKLWNMNGKLIRTFSDNEDVVTSVAFSPDGRYIACDSGDDINLWEVNGTLVRKFKGHENVVIRIAFSPDGRYLASIGGDYTLRLWTFNGENIRTFTDVSSANSNIAFSPDSRYFASTQRTGGANITMRVFHVNGRVVHKVEYTGVEDTLAFSADSRTLYYVNSPDGRDRGNQELKSLDLGGGQVLTIPHFSQIEDIKVSKDGNLIAICDVMNGITICNREGNKIRHLGIRNQQSLALTPDGSRVISSGKSHTITITELDGIVNRIVGGNTDSITSMAYSQDGRFLAHSVGTRIAIWDHEQQGINIYKIHSNDIHSLAYSRDGSKLLSADREKVAIWDSRGNVIAHWNIDKGVYMDADISPDGSYIVCGTVQYGVEIRNADGRLIRRWDDPRAKNANCVAISPDGRFILTGNYNKDIYLWTPEGVFIKEFRGHNDDVLDVAFGPDSRLFASGSYDGTIILWDREKGVLNRYQGFDDWVMAVAISPDGRFLAGGGRDNTVKSWNLETGVMRVLTESPDDVLSLAFVPGGSVLATAGMDNRVTVQDLDKPENQTMIMTAFLNGEWFVQLSNGAFDSSPEGYTYINFVQGLSLKNADQFWKGFYSPEMLRTYIMGRVLPNVDLDEAIRNVPEVEMTIVREGEADSPNVRVVVSVDPASVSIGPFFLRHNGRIITESTRGLTRLSRYETEFLIALMEGSNEIQGGAYDRSETVYGISDVEIIHYAPVVIKPPNLYILSVGVGNYSDRSLNLQSPSTDALEFIAVFKEPADKLYNDVVTQALVDERATRDEVLREMIRLNDVVKERDTVILFLAGHGFVENETYFFLPYDVDITNLESTAISVFEIGSFIELTSANKIAIFLDTCRSGSAVKSLGTIAMSRSVEEKKQIADLAKAQGIAIFSASSPTQDAFEIPQLENGIFTYSLLLAMTEKRDDISLNGKISLGKLLSCVNRITRDIAYEYLRIEQSPSMYIFGDDFYLGEF